MTSYCLCDGQTRQSLSGLSHFSARDEASGSETGMNGSNSLCAIEAYSSTVTERPVGIRYPDEYVLNLLSTSLTE